MSKRYQLTASDGSTYESDARGELGGYRKQKIYGRLDCSSAIQHRFFFKDEAAAIAAVNPIKREINTRYTMGPVFSVLIDILSTR